MTDIWSYLIGLVTLDNIRNFPLDFLHLRTFLSNKIFVFWLKTLCFLLFLDKISLSTYLLLIEDKTMLVLIQIGSMTLIDLISENGTLLQNLAL